MELPFKKNIINRTCKKIYKDYHSYKKYLEKDFNHRCAGVANPQTGLVMSIK